MIVLKIIGILLATIILLFLLVLMLRIRLMLSFNTSEGIIFRLKILFFTFGGKKKPKKEKSIPKKDEAPKKEKKPNRFLEKIKKKLGLDIIDPKTLKEDTETKGISDTAGKLIGLAMLLLGQLAWILSKMRLEKLRIIAVCGGGDAADAAMEYGLLCSTVYPFLGYIDSNFDLKEECQEIQLGCDFEGDAQFEFDLFISIRIIHLFRAVLRSLAGMAENAKEIQEETNHEQ